MATGDPKVSNYPLYDIERRLDHLEIAVNRLEDKINKIMMIDSVKDAINTIEELEK